MSDEWTYKKAGVDREKEEGAVAKVWDLISKSFTFREGKVGQPLDVKGHYAGIIDIGAEKQVALHVDGVGTKVLVAQRVGKFNTIGIDLVAMHANDLISIGAEPIAITDYLAVKEPRKKLVEEIMEGIVEGAKKSEMVVIGGESATLPEMITGINESAFDLAGMSMGLVNKGEVLTGEDVQEGNLIFGLESNGIHSNGLTLARRLFFDVRERKAHDTIEKTNTTVGEELLRPTRIYTSEVLQILKECSRIHAVGHITGGAFTKLNRLRNERLEFKLHMPKPQEIFIKLKEIGNISMREMYKTFNMGIGLVLIADEKEKEKIENICREHGTKCYILGKVGKGKSIKIETWNGEKIAFT